MFEAEADVDVDFEYENDSLYYAWDLARTRHAGVHWHSNSATVTASLLGQFEMEEATREVTFDRVYIWKLSEPNLDV